jgi:hypothetical protein
VDPDNSAQLAAVLSRLVERPEERERLAGGARAAAGKLATWRGSAELFAAAVERVT